MTNIAAPQTPAQTLVAQAAAAIDRRDARQAGELAARAVRLEPNHPGAHYLLGLAALDLRQLSQALEHLHRAASLDPKCAEYAVHFARALIRAHRANEALQIANIAVGLPPNNPLTLDTLGTVYMQCHAYERATSVFRRAAALAADNAICRFNYAVALTFAGDVDTAEAELEACLAIAPGHWRAYGVLSRLRRQTADSHHIDRLLALASSNKDDAEAQMQLHCALGKEYEDLADYAKAFEHFTLGKSSSLNRHGYSIDQDEVLVQALIRAFPEPRPQPTGYLTDEPIFIIGMPRSGTTLVERIISSHPEVYSAGELQNFGVQVERLSGARSPVMLSPAVIDRAAHIDWEQLGQRYLSSTRPMTTNKPRFIDKLPHNFLYAGFIANALPNAKIICLRRNPMDTCLSNFRELFMEGSPFHRYSFDLLDIGRYYILFDRLMAHWKRVFPDRILEIDYETLVVEQEASSRQLLDHCNLPWNDACLHFEHNQAPSATASSTQVRAPIHTTSVDRWKKYGALLDPLEQLLNDAGIVTRN